MTSPDIVGVVGATASGKTRLAIDLAHALHGEVINADALQLYRGMDIGTAKATRAEMRGIPHHLLDILDVTEEASVSAYQQQAQEAIAQIRARGRRPILVGGSGLYLRAVLDDFAFPPTDPVIRSRWEERARIQGPRALHTLLAARDPAAADAIGAHDARRIVRALEVGELTGRSFTAFLPRYEYREAGTVQIALRWDRQVLHGRIAERTARMLDAGLLDEVRALRAVGLDEGPTARRAIGYEQALAVLDGRMSEAEAQEAITAGTRRLVRKQDTWFRRDPRVHWIDMPRPAGAPSALEEALRVIRA